MTSVAVLFLQRVWRSGNVEDLSNINKQKIKFNFYMVVSVAQLVARRTHDRKVAGSIPTNAVCFTVVR